MFALCVCLSSLSGLSLVKLLFMHHHICMNLLNILAYLADRMGGNRPEIERRQTQLHQQQAEEGGHTKTPFCKTAVGQMLKTSRACFDCDSCLPTCCQRSKVIRHTAPRVKFVLCMYSAAWFEHMDAFQKHQEK